MKNGETPLSLKELLRQGENGLRHTTRIFRTPVGCKK